MAPKAGPIPAEFLEPHDRLTASVPGVQRKGVAHGIVRKEYVDVPDTSSTIPTRRVRPSA